MVSQDVCAQKSYPVPGYDLQSAPVSPERRMLPPESFSLYSLIIHLTHPSHTLAHSSTWSFTHLLTHSFTRSHMLSLTHLLIHSLTHSLTHSHTHSLIHSLTHTLTHPLTHSLTRLSTHLLTHPLTHSLTHSLTHPLTYSLIHSLIHLMTCLFLISHSSKIDNQWTTNNVLIMVFQVFYNVHDDLSFYCRFDIHPPEIRELGKF